jgi:hypothetical protein
MTTITMNEMIEHLTTTFFGMPTDEQYILGPPMPFAGPHMPDGPSEEEDIPFTQIYNANEDFPITPTNNGNEALETPKAPGAPRKKLLFNGLTSRRLFGDGEEIQDMVF